MAKEEEAGVGHNSGVAASELRGYIERIERVEAERAELADDVKDIYSEAKGRGYDTKVLRRLIALRKIDPDKRELFAQILALYADALGMEDVFG